jgi:uncharacterized protein YybS (DUF2232 family)
MNLIQELAKSGWGIGLAAVGAVVAVPLLVPPVRQALRPALKSAIKAGMAIYQDALDELEHQGADTVVEVLEQAAIEAI